MTATYEFSDDMREVLSAMVNAHRSNPDDRFFLLKSDKGYYLSHDALEIEPLSEELYTRLQRDGFIAVNRSTVTLTDRAYQAVDSDFTLEIDASDLAESPAAEEEHAEDGVPLASVPAVGDDSLAEVINKLNAMLDDPEVPAVPILETLSQVFALLAKQPDHTDDAREFVLDALAVLDMLEDAPATG